MADVEGETFTERDGIRISFRHAVPYLLQSDDVIVNKTTLLRGASDERRLSIADALPYFLGAVDEDTAYAETRLRQLRSQRDRESRRVDAAARVIDRETDRSLALLTEAAQLNMIPEVRTDIPQDVALTTLKRIARWANASGSLSESDHLQGLYTSERLLRQRYAAIRRQMDAANATIESAKGFSDTVLQQRRRLDVVGLFRRGVERDTCPVCDSPVAARTIPLAVIETALQHLDEELSEVGRDRPKIDGHLRRLSDELVDVGRALEIVRGQIAAVVAETEQAGDQFNLDERRLRVAGRVSYYLEERQGAALGIDRNQLERLDVEIQELEQIADPEAKAERVQALQNQVSIHASDILRTLPFDPNYRACQIILNIRQLTIRFVLGPRVMQMRDVGGDESYLSGHVATLLALQRVFGDGNRPVPGVLVFDQLSRPFFPADEYHGEVEIKGDDRTDLKTYFDVLFDEVATRSTLQIIVLEHAYFSDDERYVAAVKRRWTTEDKLIPADWPRLS